MPLESVWDGVGVLLVRIGAEFCRFDGGFDESVIPVMKQPTKRHG